jgi:Tfp pilus assembly protein FimT
LIDAMTTVAIAATLTMLAAPSLRVCSSSTTHLIANGLRVARNEG